MLSIRFYSSNIFTFDIILIYSVSLSKKIIVVFSNGAFGSKPSDRFHRRFLVMTATAIPLSAVVIDLPTLCLHYRLLLTICVFIGWEPGLTQNSSITNYYRELATINPRAKYISKVCVREHLLMLVDRVGHCQPIDFSTNTF